MCNFYIFKMSLMGEIIKPINDIFVYKIYFLSRNLKSYVEYCYMQEDFWYRVSWDVLL